MAGYGYNNRKRGLGLGDATVSDGVYRPGQTDMRTQQGPYTGGAQQNYIGGRAEDMRFDPRPGDPYYQDNGGESAAEEGNKMKNDPAYDRYRRELWADWQTGSGDAGDEAASERWRRKMRARGFSQQVIEQIFRETEGMGGNFGDGGEGDDGGEGADYEGENSYFKHRSWGR